MTNTKLISPYSTPKPKEILFSLDSYQHLLKDFGWEIDNWIEFWLQRGGAKINDSFWPCEPKIDWIWGLCLPLVTEIMNSLKVSKKPTLIGISALPGCGKSTLGKWIELTCCDLGIDVNVISLDDFYLPGNELDLAMSGNPWKVPRGLPGSHSMDLLENTLKNWLTSGILEAPIFDKALRNGLGDRSSWVKANPKVLILEGWFLGCKPICTGSISFEDSLSPSLSRQEINYRKFVQLKLREYLKIWKMIDRLWHLKPVDISFTEVWKREQEKKMFNSRGASLKGLALDDFVRMIQSSIPHKSLLELNSDVIVELNQSRQVVSVCKNITKI